MKKVILYLLMIASIFIPVKAKSWSRNIYEKERATKSKAANPDNWDCITTTEYKNIYGITIKTDIYASQTSMLVK